MPTRRALLTLLAAAAASVCTSPPALAIGGIVDVQIIDRSRGDVLPAWQARGASWVAGRPGERYAVRLSNRSGGRVLVVLSIDGVNAISGETASIGQTGYVLAPWSTAEITGWRKSYAEAAAFYFTALPDSYAARTERPDNVGVIGAAVFRERVPLPVLRNFEAPPPAGERQESRAQLPAQPAGAADAGAAAAPAAPDSRVANAPSASAGEGRAAFAQVRPAAKSEKLGTGHGEREYSPTTQTAFERASTQPTEVVQIRYDSYANLLAAGIIGRPRPPAVPDPFPAFVPDPR